jgi:hypothetical protein
MGSSAVAAQEYWGYLINPDKSPTPVFEQLLLGVASYIVRFSYILGLGIIDSQNFAIAEQERCPVAHQLSYTHQARIILPSSRW